MTHVVAVAGAAGKTGLAVVRALAAAGVPVRGAVRHAGQAEAVRAAGAGEAVVADLHDADSLAAAWRGAWAVYHLAPNMDAGEVPATAASLRAARLAGVRRFVYHSVLHPYAPTMPHHVRKAEAEHLVRTSGLAWTVLQPAAYVQNFVTMLPDALRTGRLTVPYATRTPFTLVDLGDVAAAAARVLGEQGHTYATYELAGAEALTVNDLARVVADATGVPVRAERVAPKAWRQDAGASLPEPTADALEAMFRHYDAHGLVGGWRVLAGLLGREPASPAAVLAGAARAVAAGAR